VEKRVHSEVVCAQRILEVQHTMFAHPSATATSKFRGLVELFDQWEWTDLQEHLAVPVVRVPEVNNGANVVGGPQGPTNQWRGCEFVHCRMIRMDDGCHACALLELENWVCPHDSCRMYYSSCMCAQRSDSEAEQASDEIVVVRFCIFELAMSHGR
jgi:hypothetical protein